jgi:hypothetical protein
MSEALDLSLLKGIPQQREEISAALLHGLKTRGGVKLKNHGLPDQVVNDLFDWVSSYNLICWKAVSAKLTCCRLASSSPFPTKTK